MQISSARISSPPSLGLVVSLENEMRLLATSIIIALAVWLCPAMLHASLVYSNDFDSAAQNGTGITTAISGGTSTGGGIAGGITSSQGYDSYSDFGGDFWRLTAPSDVLEFNITGVSPLGGVDVCFSLAMIDSWDGTSGTYGSDILNIAILDGTTQIAGLSEAYSGGNAPSTGVQSTIVQNTQLGFNNGNPYWMEDGYRMCFDNLTVSTGNLRIQFWGSSAGSGSGFQGGNDESFAIDNLSINDNISAVPEPTALSYVVLAVAGLCLRIRRRGTSAITAA